MKRTMTKMKAEIGMETSVLHLATDSKTRLVFINFVISTGSVIPILTGGTETRHHLEDADKCLFDNCLVVEVINRLRCQSDYRQ